MTTVDIVLAVVGTVVMLLVVAGMILLTPRGTVQVRAEGSEGQGSELSPVVPPVPVAPR